ncbi:MAG: hypothetical protein QM530_08105 [Phycisphaerales bacterium]|nr:hypothetical protein [Phycisphaerales bacterium]
MRTNSDIDNLLNEVQKNIPQNRFKLSFGDVWQIFEQRKKEKHTKSLLFFSCLCLLVLVAINASTLLRNNNLGENKVKQIAEEMDILNNNSIYG